ncbi:MAG: TolC family protein [Desulfobacteraceae bacterium]|nr:TolC family protein [Desulfobacteraceae bacterium]
MLVLLWLSTVCCFSFPVHAQVSVDGPFLDEPTVTLEELLKAAAQNPAVKSAHYAAAASRAVIPAASALPSPTLTFEQMGKLIPPSLMEGDPSSARTYGVEQEFPFPGKRGLKGNIASTEAESQKFNEQLAHLQVGSEIKQAFYELYFIRKSLDILLKNRDLLQNFIQIAESRYQVGKTIQQDVLKAQIELSKILDKLLVQGQKKRIAEAKINNLLHRPPETPVGKPAEYTRVELKYSLEELMALAQSSSPALKAQDSEIAKRKYGVELAKKEYFPDFALGFTYYERDQNPEMYRLMVSAKVPIYFWTKQRPELEAARLNLSSAQFMRDSTSSTVRFQVKEAYTTATTAERLAKLYSSAIVPQANLALSSAIANYQVGKIDFLQLIDASMALLEYELKYYESITEYHKAIAQLEPLVAVDLSS